MADVSDVKARELAYHEKLYAGFAQQHFAKPAVRAFRRHLVERILGVTGAGSSTHVLSLGCGIGDTEILLAPHVAHLTGVDLSPAAIAQARADASAAGIRNAEFHLGGLEQASGPFDLIIAIFFLHHLHDSELEAIPPQLASLLAPGGRFYALDPSRHRLSGAVGSLLFPRLMQRYQSDDERELSPQWTRRLFAANGYRTRLAYYDFVSSPLAGLLPSWRNAYRAARAADELLTRTPLLNRLGSNFEIFAVRPR